MAKKITELQQRFLEALSDFDKSQGDIRTAMRIAGYSDTANSANLIKSLKDEILEIAENHLAANAPKAAMNMVNTMDVAADPHIKEKMRAYEQVMDRAGVIKKDGINVGQGEQAAVFILPAKNIEDDG